MKSKGNVGAMVSADDLDDFHNWYGRGQSA